MRSTMAAGQRGEGRLWVIALALSLLLNGSLVVLLGLAAVKSELFMQDRPVAAMDRPVAENTVLIIPVTEPTPQSGRGFARTSADQSAARPEGPAFMGERDTRATSDRAPDATGPALPSQAGIAPQSPDHFETTDSDHRDGPLAELGATPTSSASANLAPAGQPLESPEPTPATTSPPTREYLSTGSNPVDVPVPRVDAASKPPQTPMQEQAAAPQKTKANSARDDPAFSGFQRKTAIHGSISRTGRSALDVADSPLGRYQAVISRAVEQEWRRNCVRHRDFITPGFVTVRFFVETSGRVRTVQFVGKIETGEVQKGFTLNSIRNAEIPPMPRSLHKEFRNESLELIFNFYF